MRVEELVPRLESIGQVEQTVETDEGEDDVDPADDELTESPGLF